MPIYEYERADGTIFEFMQKISDEPIQECPTTGQAVKRIISQNAFHLKGGGWYKTDYAGKSSSSGNNSTTTETSPASTSSNESSTSATSTSDSSSSAKACSTGCGCH